MIGLNRLHVSVLCSILSSFAFGEEKSVYTLSTLSGSSGRTLITLINLNPSIGKWYLLKLDANFKYKPKNLDENTIQSPIDTNLLVAPPSAEPDNKSEKIQESFVFHLEMRDREKKLEITEPGLNIIDTKRIEHQLYSCDLWSQNFDLRQIDFSKHKNPYFSLCNGEIYLRLRRPSDTKLSLTEWGTDLLRETNFGEGLINSIKPLIVGFSAEDAKVHESVSMQSPAFISEDSSFSMPMDILKNDLKESIDGSNLGIELKKASDSEFKVAKWYQSLLYPGVFVSLYTPHLLPKDILESFAARTFSLNEIEKDKLVYAISYPLSQYTVRFISGTEQLPIDEKAIDGLAKDFVPIGTIPPYDVASSAGVFIGGFKQRHGVILEGPLKGRSYGFIQSGVELQKMSPGLATLYSKKDGTTDIIAWPEGALAEDFKNQEVISARQNGVLILQDGEPTPFVNQWKHGNWSADANGLRTSLRAGVCVQEKKLKEQEQAQRFLIYFAFTFATPSSMAKVMQAYQCKNAMHLDMNAYVYLHHALFKIDDQNQLHVEYLHKEMHYPKGTKWHRFILDNNLRDFFYLRRR